jgi:ATP-dependent HslUV protease ATP-binding subunit HslU
MDEVTSEALALAEQHGIVFIDEIDKIAGRGNMQGPDVSREGVQRDILPLVEGSTVSTKYGPVKTDYMLFIAAGAFHVSKVSDLIPELQGRFPIKVELSSLTEEDFRKILTQPENALIKQYTALLSVDNIALEFNEEALNALAHYAFVVNESSENLGARRLHTIMESLLEDISFNAGGNYPEFKLMIDGNYVNEHLKKVAGEKDLGRFII